MTIPPCGCQLPDGTICSHQIQNILEEMIEAGDGPSVQECADDDRRWPLQREGE